MTIELDELETRLKECIERGEEIVVTKQAVPVAKVTGITRPKNRTVLGFDRDSVKILGPIDGPIIPEEDWNCLRDDFDPLR